MGFKDNWVVNIGSEVVLIDNTKKQFRGKTIILKDAIHTSTTTKKTLIEPKVKVPNNVLFPISSTVLECDTIGRNTQYNFNSLTNRYNRIETSYSKLEAIAENKLMDDIKKKVACLAITVVIDNINELSKKQFHAKTIILQNTIHKSTNTTKTLIERKVNVQKNTSFPISSAGSECDTIGRKYQFNFNSLTNRYNRMETSYSKLESIAENKLMNDIKKNVDYLATTIERTQRLRLNWKQC